MTKFFLCAIALLATSASAAVPPAQRDALISLYQATGGTSWLERANWLGPAGSECTWQRVQCDEQQANVVALNLQENNLRGNIPLQIGALTGLVSLNLSYNALEGTIPTALRSLASLEELDLGGNRLTGSIPGELADLTKLRKLSLYANDLSGPLPADLYRMRSLEILELYSNRFSGPLSGEIANLTALTYLTVASNELTGPIPAEITTLTRLNTLELLNNNFTGTIPADIGRLQELFWLDLSSNSLTGTIPPSIGTLSRLEFLGLYENALHGTIPTELGNLTELRTLYLTSNQLTGTIPESLRNLVNLQAFYLGGNRLTGEIPSWIGELKELTTIFFPGNELTGSIPPSIGQLVNLQSLYIGYNRLTGTIPREIGNLSRLGYLELEFNEIGGPIPLEFFQLTELVEIRMNDMALTGSLPSAIGNLQRADVMLLSNNHLEGTIPPEIGSLQALLYLSLGANRLTGPIPREIGLLENLVQIDLYANALRGAIPPEIAGMTSLADESSDFSFNALFATDAATRAFVNRKQIGDDDFEGTQTLTPGNVRITQTTDRSATLEWDVIRYASDPGGYQVTAKTAGGATAAIATTSHKEQASITVRNLDASTTYFFTVAAVTHPHDYQKNLLVSDPSPTVSTTTGARVIAPADVVMTEAPTGLIQIDGAAVNEDAFTLTNFGDTATSVTLVKEGSFFTMEPQAFPLAGGASQRVILRSVPQPAGSYYGAIDPEGAGVGDDVFVGVTLLSAARPAGTVIAEALSTRIEIAGAPGSDSVGQARFRNRGTAVLRGIVLSDQPWVVPSAEPITIHPNEVGTVNFTVVRSRRPPEATGALSANLSLVYVDGSGTSSIAPPLKSAILNGTTGVNVTLVTIVDTPKPPVAAAPLPGIAGSEVVWFAAGITSIGSFVSDVSVMNSGTSRPIDDLRIFFTPAGGSPSVATMNSLAPAQAVTLANVVTNVYSAASAVGSLQFRSAAWQNLAPAARLVSAGEPGTRIGEVPVFRSDRAVGPGQEMFLTGLRKGGGMRSDLYVQETGGAPASVRIELLTASGSSAGSRDVELTPFGMAQLVDAVPAAAVTAVVTNSGGSSGRIAAYARIIEEATSDTWSVVDWPRQQRFTMSEAVRIPFADGAAPVPGGGSGRRRAVTHATRTMTDVSIFNPAAESLRARVTVIESGGRTSSREVNVGPRQTLVLGDAAGPAASPTASIVITPLAGGQLVASARSSRGTAVPVVPAAAGLRIGQSQRFPALPDSTAATVAAARPGTFRTSFGLVETSGQPATVRARLYLDGGRALVTAILYRDFSVGAGQQIVTDNLVRAILGEGRETSLGELHGVQLHIEVIGGSGSVIPFVIVTDNGSGDTLLRLE